jgi:hypothetical protein
MFDALISVVGTMADQLQTLQQKQFVFGFENIVKKFTSMPTLEVAPNLNFSSLIEEVGKNSTDAAGTVLLSGGSPVAVIFNMEQVSLLNKIVNFIPAVIQHMHDTIKFRVDFKEKLQECSVGLLKAGGDFFHLLPYFILVGTIATVTGAFFLGTRYQENDLNKSKMRYLAPGFIFGCGIGSLIMSAFGASQVSSAFFDVAKSIRSFPQ